ncbi:Cullin-1, partial [Bienertia sinuspersici]
VLPTLGDKNDASFLLTELVAKWSSYQKMAKCLSRFLCYLERYYIPCVGALGLLELAFRCFYNLVNAKFNAKLIPAAMSLVGQLLLLIRIATGRRLIGTEELTLECCGLFLHCEKSDSSRICFTWASASFICGLYVEWCLKQEYERASHFFNLPLK